MACAPNAVPIHPARVIAISGRSWLPRDATVPALVGVVSLAAWGALWQLGHFFPPPPPPPLGQTCTGPSTMLAFGEIFIRRLGAHDYRDDAADDHAAPADLPQAHSRRDRNGPLLTVLVVAGYLAVWTALRCRGVCPRTPLLQTVDRRQHLARHLPTRAGGGALRCWPERSSSPT